MIRVPIYRHMGLGNLNYRDPRFQAVIKAAFNLRPDGHAIDIGANLGTFLLNLVAIDRSKPYLGFEPLIEAAAYISRNIVENRLERHTIIPIALSDHQGMTSIRFNSEADASATISDSMRPTGRYRKEQIVATSIADIQLRNVSSIALVKLDVEGGELGVLRGMMTTLDRHRPPILLEVMPYAYLFDGSYKRSYFGNLKES